jgi:hypothetical protein
MICLHRKENKYVTGLECSIPVCCVELLLIFNGDFSCIGFSFGLIFLQTLVAATCFGLK